VTLNDFSWRQAARAAIRGSLVARALTGSARRIAAAAGLTGAGVMILLGWLLASTTADDDLVIDERRARTMLEDGWIARRARSATSIVSARWQASATASALANLCVEVAALAPTERVRLIGFAITAALTTHAALTRFDLFIRRSPWLVGWGAVVLVTVVLLRHPAAIAAAWSHRKR